VELILNELSYEVGRCFKAGIKGARKAGSSLTGCKTEAHSMCYVPKANMRLEFCRGEGAYSIA